MLPRIKLDVYPQVPYESIDKATYDAMVKNLKPIDWEAMEVSPDSPVKGIFSLFYSHPQKPREMCCFLLEKPTSAIQNNPF